MLVFSGYPYAKLLPDLARARYPADLNRSPWPTKCRLDVVVEGDAM